jgi:dephospho-CoA kinase
MTNDKSMIIGLTGTMAAGKNEVAKILKRQGAVVIEADEEAHALYVPQSPVWREVVMAFGSKILKRGGEINRKKLGQIVFSDRRKLQELNRIVHPRLREEIISKVERLRRAQSSRRKSKVDSRMMVVNAAVLKEIGLVDVVDEVWVVAAPKELRIARSGLPRKEAEKRMRAQMPQAEYLALADVVINNNGTLRQLDRQIKRIVCSRNMCEVK